MRRSLGIGETPLIGYSGRFVEEKRPDLLLRALAHLEDRLPGAHVAFAGQYIMPYEHFYQQSLPLIERWGNRVHFLGLIEDEHELADFYAACDVLVLPSSSDLYLPASHTRLNVMTCFTSLPAPGWRGWVSAFSGSGQ